MVKVERRVLVVKYPPDYDGELHVRTERLQDAIGAVVTITLEVRERHGETVVQTVKRAATDMLRAR